MSAHSKPLPLYFHVDMDAFFAAAEQARNPVYKDKPLVIGGSSGRGVVATCSYQARSYGVKSGMPMFEALRRCPDLVVVQGDMHYYRQVSARIMELFHEFSPYVQQISIDEAFLDMTGTERLLGMPREVAKKIQQRVYEELGLGLSVGIGAYKYVAKVASAEQKPMCITEIARGTEASYLQSKSFSELWGIGPHIEARLHKANIYTAELLATIKLDALSRLVGAYSAELIYKILRGEDPGIFDKPRKTQSCSAETTFRQDLKEEIDIARHLLALSREVSFRCLELGVPAQTVSVKIVDADHRMRSRQRKVDWGKQKEGYVLSVHELYSLARELVSELWLGEPLRRIGVQVGGAISGAAQPSGATRGSTQRGLQAQSQRAAQRGAQRAQAAEDEQLNFIWDEAAHEQASAAEAEQTRSLECKQAFQKILYKLEKEGRGLLPASLLDAEDVKYSSAHYSHSRKSSKS